MSRVIVLLTAILALGCTGAVAEDKKGKKVGELAATVVITNEVLERLYGPAPQQPAPPAVPEPAAAFPLPDPLEAMEVEAGALQNRRNRAMAVRKEIAALEARLQELEKRKLAAANPYLPRPALSPEEQEAWSGLDGAARVARTEADIRGVRQELDAAREMLARLNRGS